MDELVCEKTFELGRGCHAEKPAADRECGATGPTARAERPWITVGQNVELRHRHACKRREPLDRRVERRRLATWQLACSDHPERDPIDVEIAGAGE